jgi:hypothetical protein
VLDVVVSDAERMGLEAADNAGDETAERWPPHPVHRDDGRERRPERCGHAIGGSRCDEGLALVSRDGHDLAEK